MDLTALINSFFKTSFMYFGKEIAIPTNQLFRIVELINEETEDEYMYRIQYGFPNSGSVSMKIGISKSKKAAFIDDISVYALPPDKDMTIVNFNRREDYGPFGFEINVGIDIGTKEYKSLEEIENNPNAIGMIEFAISDLQKAQIMDECRMAVPIGSTEIPCCNTTRWPSVKRDL